MALFPQESKKDLAILSIGFSHFPQSPKLSLRDINESNPSYQPASMPVSLTSSPSHRNLAATPFVVSSNNNGSSKRRIVLSQKKSSSRLKSNPKSSMGADNHTVKYLDLSQMHANNENTESQRAFMISSAKVIREETPIPTARRSTNMMVLALNDQSSQRNLNSGMGNMPTEHFNDKFQKKYEHFRRTQNNTLKQYLGKFRSITEIKNRAEGKGNMITVQPAFTKINGDLDIATSRLFSTKKQKTIYLEKKAKELIRIKRRVLDGEVMETNTTSKRALPKEDDDFGLNERRPTTEIDTNYLQYSMASLGPMTFNNTRLQETTSLLLEKEKFFNQVRGEEAPSYQRLPNTVVTQNFYLGEKDSPRRSLHKKTFSLFNYSDALSKYDNSIYQEKMYQNNLMSAQNSPLSPKQDPLKVFPSPKMQAMRSSYDEISFKKQFQSTGNLLQQGQRGMPSPPVQRKMVICKPVAPELVVDVDSPRRAVKHTRVASATMSGHFMASDSVKSKGKKVIKNFKSDEGKTPKSYIVSSSSSSKALNVVTTTDLKKSQVFRYEQQESIIEPKSADASPTKNTLLQSKYKRKGTNQKVVDTSDQLSDFKLEGW